MVQIDPSNRSYLFPGDQLLEADGLRVHCRLRAVEHEGDGAPVCSLRLMHIVPEQVLAAVSAEIRGRRAADLRVESPSTAARACNLQS
jgi:hypothetical protein